MSNLKLQLAYLASGMLGGMVISYLYLESYWQEDADDDPRDESDTLMHHRAVSATPSARKPVQRQSASTQTTSSAPESSATEAKNVSESDAESKPLQEQKAVAPADSVQLSSTAYDRHVGWSSWNSEQNAFRVEKVDSIEECEKLCDTEEECHSSTVVKSSVGKVCLFHV